MGEHFPDATKKVDFIRRDKVHVQIERALCEGLPYQRTIDDIPAADVVEVVRCKDCINWNGNDCITMYGLYAPMPNDYCSRGEKNSG